MLISAGCLLVFFGFLSFHAFFFSVSGSDMLLSVLCVRVQGMMAVIGVSLLLVANANIISGSVN